jgi:hypothetical protein
MDAVAGTEVPGTTARDMAYGRRRFLVRATLSVAAIGTAFAAARPSATLRHELQRASAVGDHNVGFRPRLPERRVR